MRHALLFKYKVRGAFDFLRRLWPRIKNLQKSYVIQNNSITLLLVIIAIIVHYSFSAKDTAISLITNFTSIYNSSNSLLKNYRI